MFKRDDDIEICLSKLNENKSVHLTGPNGIGKTTFLKQLLGLDKEIRKTNQINFDLLYISSAKQFYISFIEKTKDFFEEKPKSKNEIDTIIYGDGLGKLTLNKFEESKLSEIFIDLIKYLNTKKRNTLIIYNSFQLISQLLDKNKIMLLFSNLFDLEKVQFIFSGTQNMVLFENLENISLKKLDTDTLKRSIAEKFDKEKITINKKSMNLLVDWSKGDMAAISDITQKLFKKRLTKVKRPHVRIVIDEIISENQKYAQLLRDLLSVYQWRLLISIAKEGLAQQVTSKDFIAKYELNAPSSIKTALKALIEKNLILQNGTTYKIANVVLMRVLAEKQ